MISKSLHLLKLKYLILFSLIAIFSCQDDIREVVLYEKGVLDASSTATSIKAGETVSFMDLSTKVKSRVWTFSGGLPASSTAENMTVTYEKGGSYVATLVVKYIDNQTAEKQFSIEVEAAPIVQGPYSGSALAIPGTLEVENYDLGGEGVAYHDTEEENRAETAGSATYRADDGIDIEVGTNIVNIGYAAAAEWAEYTVNVQETAAYNFDFYVASSPGGSALKVQLVEETTITDLGELPAFPSTGGWGNYIPITVPGINLSAGEQILRLYFTGGSVNVDKIIISAPGVNVVEKYSIYTESAVTTGSPSSTEINNAFTISTITTDVFEGSEALAFKFVPQDTWGVMGAIRPSNSEGVFVTADITDFSTGFFNITLKTTCTLKMNLRLQGNGTNGYIQLDDAVKKYGFIRDGAWHTLKIPIADFKTDGGATPDYSKISHFLVLRSAEGAVTATEDWDWYVDDVYLSKE